mgnify:FL=1
MKKIPEDIRELEEKIARQREKENRLREPAGASEYAGAAGVGRRIAAEFLSAVLVGGAVGYVIDRMAGSRPFFLTAFLFLGGAAGILNVYRLAKAEDERKTNKE